MLIRTERDNDEAAIHRVNVSAFETPAEADLVDALREHAAPIISLVAEDGEAVVGHIMFSPVSLSSHPALAVMGLAPVAVTPTHQRQGVGSALIRAGLERCKAIGCSAVVVLGHPAYYPRFGFLPASRFGLRCAYEVPDEAFMALELQPGALKGTSGLVHYHAAFGESL